MWYGVEKSIYDFEWMVGEDLVKYWWCYVDMRF